MVTGKSGTTERKPLVVSDRLAGIRGNAGYHGCSLWTQNGGIIVQIEQSASAHEHSFSGRALGLHASINPQTASAFALFPRAILMWIRNRGSL
jgi:hypothetical protein